MTHTTEQERAEFQEWALSKWPLMDVRTRSQDGNYADFETRTHFMAWQEAAARRAPAVPETIEQRAKKLKGLQVLTGATAGVPEAIALARSRFVEAYGRSPLHDDLAYACLLIDAYCGAPALPVPQFNHPAKRKLNILLGAGEEITGYAFQNKDGRRGSIDCHGFVAWWQDAAAPQTPEADHIPDAGKMDANVCNWMNAALSKDVACPACGLSGLHACPSASTAESQGADAVKALEKVLRAVQRHLPPERIGERETIAEIISIVDPWPLGKPPAPWKDHMTAELVGKLTDVARQFHGTQQLRERIAGLVRPVCERIKQFDGDRMPEVDMGNPISAAAPVQLPEPPFWYCESKTPDAIWPIGRTTKKRESAFKDGYFNQQALYTEQQVRQLLAAHGIKEQST